LVKAVERMVMLVEQRIAPALERIAAAVEKAPAVTVDPLAAAVLGVRDAIETDQWAVAYSRVHALLNDFPDAAQGESLLEEVTRGRETAVERLRAELQAAREVNDADQVIAVRDQLATLISSEEKRALDRETIERLMVVLQKRLRGGIISGRVVELATKMVDRFADTKEGASLRAALPTLRRSAGLCGRCGQPYRGLADACPRCTGVPDPEVDEDFLKSPSPQLDGGRAVGKDEGESSSRGGL
jgi:hypothetical protein